MALRTLVPTASVIAALVAGIFLLGFALVAATGLPEQLAPPVWVREVGLAGVVFGLAMMGWLFRYRGFRNVLVSTYVTFLKISGKRALGDMAERTEPLVVAGPHKYVRHPLYFGVVVMVLGWGLFTGYVFLFVTDAFLLLWFTFVVARFEERELKVIFGEAYERYAEGVPKMIPLLRIRRRRRSPVGGQAP